MFNFNLTRSTQNKNEKKGGKIKKRRKRGQSFVSGYGGRSRAKQTHCNRQRSGSVLPSHSPCIGNLKMIFAAHILSAALFIPLASAFVPSAHHVPTGTSSSSVTRLHSSTSAVNNVVLSPSDEAENFDSYAIGTPRVHRYLRDDGSDDAEYGELFFQIVLRSSTIIPITGLQVFFVYRILLILQSCGTTAAVRI